MGERPPLTYAEAGVSLEAADAVVERLRAAVESTRTPLVLGSLGGFAGLISAAKFSDPVLAAGTDTVGSKALLQRQTGRLHELGIDLVAMSVNDVITCGAEPVLFLDCVSVGRLDPDRIAQLVEGVADGCRQAGCALLGGETAEMPDLYGARRLRRGRLRRRSRRAPPARRRRARRGGDAVIGLASTGVHANGFTLVRRLLERAGVDPSDAPAGLLAPTAIYASAVRG